MAEINLLPGELRSKEEKELAAIRKIPRVVKIEMSKPPKEKKPSFFRRFFRRKKKAEKPEEKKPTAPIPPKPEDKPVFKPEEKINLPKGQPPRPLVLAKPPKEKKPSFFRRFFRRKKDKLKEPAPVKLLAGKPAVVAKPVLPPAPPVKPPGPPPMPLSPPLPVKNNSGKIFGAVSAKDKPNGSFNGNLPPPKEKKISLEEELKELLPPQKPVLPEKKPVLPEKGPVYSGPKPVLPEKKPATLPAKKVKKIKPAVTGVNLLFQIRGGGWELEDFKQKLIIGGAVGFGAAVLVAGVYLGIVVFQKSFDGKISQLKAQIVSLDQQIAAQEAKKTEALDLQRRLGLIKDLLARHIYWTKFFGLLEKYTIDEVYYTNFSLAGREKLVISAVGRDYKSVAKQLLAFEQAKDFVKSVRIDSASADVDPQKAVYLGVKFNINLEFLPDIFLKSAE